MTTNFFCAFMSALSELLNVFFFLFIYQKQNPTYVFQYQWIIDYMLNLSILIPILTRNSLLFKYYINIYDYITYI